MPPSGNALLDALSGEGARDVAENPFLNAGNAIQAIKMPSSPYRSDTAGPIFAQALLGGGLQQYGISQVEQQRQDRLDALNAIGAPPAFNPTDPAGLQGYLKGQADYVNNARSTLGGNPATASLAAVLGAGGLENAVGLNQAINTGLATNAVKWAPNAGLLGVLGGGSAPAMGGGNPLAGDSLQPGTSNVVAGPSRPSLAGAVDPKSEAAALLTSTRRGVGVPTLAQTAGAATGYSNPQSAAALTTSEDLQAKGQAAIKSAAQTDKIMQDLENMQKAAKTASPEVQKHILEGSEFVAELHRIQKEDLPAAKKEADGFAKRFGLNAGDADYAERLARLVPGGATTSNLYTNALHSAAYGVAHTKFGRLTEFDTPSEQEQLAAPGLLGISGVNSNIDRAIRRAMTAMQASIQSGQVLDANQLSKISPEMFTGSPVTDGASSGSSSSAANASPPPGLSFQQFQAWKRQNGS